VSGGVGERGEPTAGGDVAGGAADNVPRGIDAHFHLWRYRAAEYAWIDDAMAALRRDVLGDEIAGVFAAHGVRGGVAVQARSSLHETAFLLAAQAECSAFLGVVGWVDLCAPDVGAVLERYAGRLTGVRHVVQAEPDDAFLLRADFQRGVALLPSFGMTYDLLIYPRHLPAARVFADRNPDLRIVLDHLAKPPIAAGHIEPWARELRALAERPHVLAKVSGLVTEADRATWTADQLRRYLDVAFRAFGADRLMFGSDFPVCTVAASYRQVRQIVDDHVAALSPAERAGVLADNAIACYRLPAA
jgi:L-fuconolactonase